ncbi:TonB-dependent receptor [Salinimicrobium sediminilitoris]|uniref:TonB-dependent receptor n=1 Tax=Salinimicrobium sediminilitoris TaxID=2876715 RepID=UPI001E5831B7|nr:TonB-dependent receptor [Salinimicrobium sediminilitoris]MCC8360136.1 TonB-dependent receptor [Salinimicrobium sediminilitoris]
MKPLFFIFFIFGFFTSLAQTTVSGKVVDSNNSPVPGVNIIVFGTTQGTATDLDGKFSFVVTQDPPFSLAVSSMGYEEKRIQVTENNANLEIVLNQGTSLDEIVVSASRTPERIFESPVTIEHYGLKEIQNTPSASFYGGLENLKGVDINTNSLTFQSVNTRGFATFNNPRFVQLVDGMDNSSPALNFVLGNLLGMTELDVYSVELLPGASSALYGANAFNGILFMKSKNPFDFPGISAYYKQGFTSQDAAGTNPVYDFGVRLAHKFSDKWAAKVNFSYLEGTDWFATSQEDVLNPGRTRMHPNYDGLNIYGDEVSTNIRVVGEGLAAAGLIPEEAVALLPDEAVSRTGYAEQDLTDYEAKSVKFDAAIHFRPFADDFEISYLGKAGFGSTIYQGGNRYALKDFFLQQHKLEVQNNNFFVRGYITDEDAGDSYDIRFTGINVNRRWKTDQQWFGQYAGAFVQARSQGAPEDQAHMVARQVAETGRFEPGTAEFQQAFDEVTTDSDLLTGSQFTDASQIRHVDANYNFTHLTSDIAEVQVGGSFREYRLNSSGTIFTDYDGPISYSEYGIYTQVQKKFIDERLKLTGSIRYDDSELFEGNFSPRLSVGYTAGDSREHNFRASVQTGFRYPTTQDLFIGLDVGRAILVGSAEDNLDRYVRTFELSATGAAVTGSPTAEISGRNAYENSFSVASVQAGAPAAAENELVKPEQVTAYELGYRGKLGQVVLDINAYYNIYEDFISTENVLVPFYGQVGDSQLSLLALQQGDYRVFQTYTNSPADVKSYGTSLGLTTKIFGDYDFGANYTYAQEDFDQSSAPDFQTNFNTPEHKVKLFFGNTDLFDNFGFGINYRWSDAFMWQASFANGKVPAYSVVDAQVNYALPAVNSVIKAGATNIGGDEYYTAYGTGYIGQQYYLSLTFQGF